MTPHPVPTPAREAPGDPQWLVTLLAGDSSKEIFSCGRRIEHWPPRDRAGDHRMHAAAQALADALGHETNVSAGELRQSYQLLQRKLQASARPSPFRPVVRPPWIRIPAAAWLVMVLIVGATGIMISQFVTSPASASIHTSYTTRRGERAQFTLPDGTQVILAPESRLTFDGSFGRGARDIGLQGQASFTVRHDPSSVFTVHTRGSMTRVLGTVFSVRAYATDRDVRVAVAEGKVAFGRDGALAPLLAGDSGWLGGSGTPVVSRTASLGEAFGWTHGQLIYDDVPLRDILPDLERAYDIRIRVTDPALEALPLRAVLIGDDVDTVLRTIEVALVVDITRQGRNVTITPRSLR